MAEPPFKKADIPFKFAEILSGLGMLQQQGEGRPVTDELTPPEVLLACIGACNGLACMVGSVHHNMGASSGSELATQVAILRRVATSLFNQARDLEVGLIARAKIEADAAAASKASPT